MTEAKHTLLGNSNIELLPKKRLTVRSFSFSILLGGCETRKLRSRKLLQLCGSSGFAFLASLLLLMIILFEAETEV